MIYFFFIFCIALPQMFLDKSAVRELRETIRVCKAVILLKCILLYRADDADGYCSIDDDVPSKPPSRVQTFQLRERPPAPLPDTRRRHSCSFTSTDLRQKPLPSLPDISQKPLPPPPGHEKPEPARKPPPNLKPAILSRPPARATQPSPVTMGRFPGRSSDSSGLTPQGYENVVNQLQKAKVNPTDMRGNMFFITLKEKGGLEIRKQSH